MVKKKKRTPSAISGERGQTGQKPREKKKSPDASKNPKGEMAHQNPLKNADLRFVTRKRTLPSFQFIKTKPHVGRG